MSEMVWSFPSWTHLLECQNVCLNHPGGVKAQLWGGVDIQSKLYQSRTYGMRILTKACQFDS